MENERKKIDALARQHDDMHEKWLHNVDEFENDSKRKAKREKTREYFEKVFPELRKQREEKERCQRLGARNMTATGFAKSDADLDQILDNLQEKEVCLFYYYFLTAMFKWLVCDVGRGKTNTNGCLCCSNYAGTM